MLNGDFHRSQSAAILIALMQGRRGSVRAWPLR